VYASALPGDEFVFDDKMLQRDSRILGKTPLWTVFASDYWGTYLPMSHNL